MALKDTWINQDTTMDASPDIPNMLAAAIIQNENNIKKLAEDAANLGEYAPYIDENGNWFEYDTESEGFVDTGVKAKGEDGEDGHSPYISNGTWYVWSENEGDYLPDIEAQGKEGQGINLIEITDGGALAVELSEEGYKELGQVVPKKGIDYWTDADKAEIKSDVAAFVVNLTLEDNIWTADKTYEQIRNAYFSGREVKVVEEKKVAYLDDNGGTDFYYGFTCFANGNQITYYVSEDNSWDVYYTHIATRADVNRAVGDVKSAIDDKLARLAYYGDVNIEPSDSSLFEFTTDDTTMTASVEAKSNDISGDIVIPYEYVVDGKVYSVTKINDCGFIDAPPITSVVIPGSVVSVGYSAFDSCPFTRVVIFDGLTTVGLDMFFGCTALMSIVIPSSVTTIDFNAFKGCDSLTDIYYKGTEAQWDAIEMEDGNEVLQNATIHYNWSDVTKDYVNEQIGDIETALDNILVIQNELMGVSE